MSPPDEQPHGLENQRMDALSEAIGRVLRRLESLEGRLTAIEQRVGIPAYQPVAMAPPIPRNEPIPPPLPIAVATPPPMNFGPLPDGETLPLAEVQPARPKIETRFGLTLVNRVGAITSIIAVAFFFKYAVDNGMIGETGRVALGIIAGLVALAGGDVLWKRGQKVFAQGITGLGIAILYLSFFAGFAYYHKLPQSLAFVSMLVVTSAAGALALRYNAVAIAVLGLFGGYATPLLLSTGQDAPWIFFGYLTLLNVGALAIARARGWILLEWLAFISTAILYLAWVGQWYRAGKELVATVFVLSYYAMSCTVRSRWIHALSHAFTAMALAAIFSPSSSSVPAFLVLSVLLAFAGMAIADLRNWGTALSVSFTFFWLTFLGWASDHNWVSDHTSKPIGALFLTITVAFLLFFFWMPWRVVYRKVPIRRFEYLIIILNGAAYFGMGYALMEPAYHAFIGLFSVALAALHLGLGMWVWQSQPADKRDARPVLLSAGVALCFLTLAVPIQFVGYRITLSWALEGAALAWIANRTKERKMLLGVFAIFLLVLGRLFLIDGIPTPANTHAALANPRFLTFVVSAIAMWLAAWWIRPSKLAAFPYIAGHFVFLITCGMEVLDSVERTTTPANVSNSSSTWMSILMAIYGVMLVTLGVYGRSALNRYMGLGLLAIVVLKLYLYDVWKLGGAYLIGAFAALGALLLLTSYVYSRYRSTIESWLKDAPSENLPS